MNTYNINISKLCELCGLGILLSEPAPINGGFLHRMYDVKTDKEHFKAFINGYQSITSVGKFNVEAVLYSSLEGKISWLEYNLKRSLGIECADENERKLGTEQVIYAIGQIERYVQAFDEITACFNEVI